MDGIKEKLEAEFKNYDAKSLNSGMLERMQEDLIFASSEYEGLTITKEEAQKCVKDDNINKDDVLKIKQAKGQKRAIDFIEGLAKSDKPLDIYVIKDIQKIIFEECYDESLLKYRTQEVEIRRSKHLPPHPSKVAEEMYFYDKWLVESQKSLDLSNVWQVLQIATKAFTKFLWIHPFADGNGRTARMVMNFFLRKAGLPYVIIPKSGKTVKLKEALQQADGGDLELAYDVFGEYLLDSLKLTKQ